jgi:hypothetical protein
MERQLRGQAGVLQPAAETNPAVDAEAERLRASLAERPFAARVGSDLDRQRRLERQYIEAAAEANVLRADYLRFGQRAPAAPGLTSTALAATLDAATGFLGSASRSPAVGAVITELSPATRYRQGEFDNKLDPTVIGGAVGGVAAYLAGILQIAMQRTAKAFNLESLHAVDLKVLLPDPPAIKLTFAPNGQKTYEELDPMAQLQARQAVEERRLELGKWMDMLAGKGLVGANLKPGVTAAFNVARRAGTSEAGLLNSAQLHWQSALASGGAAAVVKGVSGLLKGWHTTIEDFDHNPVSATLYEAKRPRADRPAANLHSLRRLPHAGLHTLQEALAMTRAAASSVSSVKGAVVDVMRHCMANTVAAVTSQGGGLIWASLGWGTTAPPAGESLQSGNNLLRQAATSYYNDVVWDGAKELMASRSPDLGSRLDGVRETRKVELSDRVLPESLVRVQSAFSRLQEREGPLQVTAARFSTLWFAEGGAIPADAVAGQRRELARLKKDLGTSEENLRDLADSATLGRELRVFHRALSELIAIDRQADPQAPGAWRSPTRDAAV